MIRVGLIWLVLALPLSAAPELTGRFGPEGAARHLLIRSTTDLAVMAPVLAAWVALRPDLAISYEQWGSNALHERSLAECAAGFAGQARADLILSSAVHQMVDLVNRGCARPHLSDQTRALPPALRWRDELWGLSREPAVIVFNRDLVPPDQVPRSRFDLLDLLRPADSPYAGRVATYDIEASGLGYLLAFADSLQSTSFGALLESFGRAGVVATCCSAEIIADVIAGRHLIAYNVLGSYALARAAEQPVLGLVAPHDYTLVLSRAAMIPRTAPAWSEAAALIDFLLSEPGRAELRRALLIVDLEPGDGTLIDIPEGIETRQRPIALSPALLVALDRHKRMLFAERWRAAFPHRPMAASRISDY